MPLENLIAKTRFSEGREERLGVEHRGIRSKLDGLHGLHDDGFEGSRPVLYV